MEKVGIHIINQGKDYIMPCRQRIQCEAITLEQRRNHGTNRLGLCALKVVA
jgi:hypothetical protein